MSHGVSPVSLKDVSAIVGAEPFRISAVWKGVSGLLIVLGVAAFGYEFTHDAKHAWSALQVNVIFWTCLAAASSCFTAVFHICNAQWARPIQRLFASTSNFFMFTPLFLVVMYFGGAYEHLFVWSHVPAPGKASWLQPGFVYTRDVLGLCLLVVLSRKVMKLSVRKDLDAIRSGLTGLPQEKIARWTDKKYDCYFCSTKAEGRASIQQSDDKMGRLSPVVIMIYALAMSLFAFDQIMSVDPHWFSTMFGGFIFMGGVYLAVAFVCMFVGVARANHALFRAKVERRTLHDLGKLLFGFGIFWAYLFWSQYLPIWYANMPEETGYLVLRLREKPWHDVAWMVLGFCFIIPFLLGLSRDVKQVPPLLFCTGAIASCGIWMLGYLLFLPSLYPSVIPFTCVEVGVTLGFLGAFFLCVVGFLEKTPLMPFGDLYLEQH